MKYQKPVITSLNQATAHTGWVCASGGGANFPNEMCIAGTLGIGESPPERTACFPGSGTTGTLVTACSAGSGTNGLNFSDCSSGGSASFPYGCVAGPSG